MEIQKVKQRFGITGNSASVNHAIDIALQVSSTDLSVLIQGESGTGKEVFPKFIHQFSSRKHESNIAVNCGAIPEGTIDSELFGHEKGAFTGASDTRKGYFEVADKGTIFLDEIGELPKSTQVRLLRVLEAGEFMRVGSSKVQKTNVRVVAASNVKMNEAISQNKFREDLYYRISTVPIMISPLRERKEDIHLLFRKFALDFADKYRMPALRLNEEAIKLLVNFKWPGNVRQLKNITEQISIIESDRIVNADTLIKYLPTIDNNQLPAIYKPIDEKTFSSEREILYQVLFDMKHDVNELKKLVYNIMKDGTVDNNVSNDNEGLIRNITEEFKNAPGRSVNDFEEHNQNVDPDSPIIEDTEEFVEESLLLKDKEIELIIKALSKHNGKRKYAAKDLGISERTLYRKINEYNI